MKTKQEILERIKDIDKKAIEIEKKMRDKILPTSIYLECGNDLVELWQRKEMLEWVLSEKAEL
jgi:hypothetical protein